MKLLKLNLFLLSFLPLILSGQQDTSGLILPDIHELASVFGAPPASHGPTLLWGWEGPVDREIIIRDLDKIRSLNLRSVTIEAGYNMMEPYLSEGWFELIRFAVEQVRQRDMVVWLIDEGKYPSGFAGGLFSRERPDLTMQGLAVSSRNRVTQGEVIAKKVHPDVVSAVAFNLADSTYQVIRIRNGLMEWTVPRGDWQLLTVTHRFRTSVTRAANNPTRGKDTVNALCDYLNPEATRQFLAFTHEQYKKYIGKEFGKTVLGFRGDEPDYGFIPWTPRLPDVFSCRKGYDVRPYLAAFFLPITDDTIQRIRADYWDVWSDMFGESYFKVLANWCGDNHLSYMTHLNHEDQMVALARSSGDFFENLRHVQIPGVDAIWNQIWPDRVADFPKYASSVAHLYGQRFVLSESFAAYRTAPDLKQAKWVIDHQFARGINLFEFMFWASSASGWKNPSGWMADERFPSVVTYVNRMSCLLSMGRPAASIAVYYPTTSLWLGDMDADAAVLRLMQQMLEQQRDFDFVDEYTLTHVLEPVEGGLRNRSGQVYKAVLVPPCTAISRAASNRLKEFSQSGNTVIFISDPPSMVVDSIFRYATEGVEPDYGVRQPSVNITPAVINALPMPDVRLDPAQPSVKVLHRHMKNAELYFFFNESGDVIKASATLRGRGKAQVWDAFTGKITPVSGAKKARQTITVPLALDGYESRVIVIGPVPRSKNVTHH